MAKKKITIILLSKTSAATKVPINDPMKIMEAILRSVSTIFLICLLNPMRKPVL